MFLELNCLPSHHTLVVKMTNPTPEQKAAIALLDVDLQTVLKQRWVAYEICKLLADRGFTSIGYFVELWDSKAELKEKAPAQFHYAPADPAHPEPSELEKLQCYNVQLACAYKAALRREKHLNEVRASIDHNSKSRLDKLISGPERETMRKLWAERHDGEEPCLESEGSKNLYRDGDVAFGLVTRAR